MMKHPATENLEKYYTVKLGEKVYNDLINEQNTTSNVEQHYTVKLREKVYNDLINEQNG